MNEALTELFTRFGFDRRMLWRLSVLFWIVLVASCVGAVYLSAHSKQEFIVAGLYIYLVLVALPLLFAPAFWLVAGGLFALAGQFGREQGLSLRDAVAAVKEYGTPVIDKAGYVLLLAIPVWFIAMLFINTKGLEIWFIGGLPLLPTTIYLVVRRWPEGKTFEAVVRTTLLAFMFIVLGWGVINTINRLLTEPATLVAEESVNQEEERAKKERAELVRLVDIEVKAGRRELIKNKKALAIYDEEMAKARQPKINRALESVGLTASAVSGTVGGATSAANSSTSASWLGKYWPAVVVAAILVFLAWRFIRRRKTVTATVTVAASPAAKSSSLWDWIGHIVLFLSLLWFWWFFTLGQTQVITMHFDNRLGDYVTTDFPVGSKVTWVIRGNRGVVMTEVTLPDGTTKRFDLGRQIMIEGAMQGQCFTQPSGRSSPVNFPIWGSEELSLPLAARQTVTVVFQVCPEGSPIGESLQRWGNQYIPSFL